MFWNFVKVCTVVRVSFSKLYQVLNQENNRFYLELESSPLPRCRNVNKGENKALSIRLNRKPDLLKTVKKPSKSLKNLYTRLSVILHSSTFVSVNFLRNLKKRKVSLYRLSTIFYFSSLILSISLLVPSLFHFLSDLTILKPLYFPLPSRHLLLPTFGYHSRPALSKRAHRTKITILKAKRTFPSVGPNANHRINSRSTSPIAKCELTPHSCALDLLREPTSVVTLQETSNNFWSFFGAECKTIKPLKQPKLEMKHSATRRRTLLHTTEDQELGKATLKINRLIFRLNCRNVYKDRRHRKAHIIETLQESENVEENPGPKPQQHDIQVISYNVRGLNDEIKLRHLVNLFYKTARGKNQDFIACLQETYLINSGKLPYLWRGNIHVTPGLGNSLGCITLLSSHLNVTHSKNFGNRAHLIVVEKLNEQKPAYVLINLYAPNPNNEEKINFFEELLNEALEMQIRYDCQKVIVAGDYNLTFDINESKNRNFSAQERNVARAVMSFMQDLNLIDIWKSSKKFTWRRPNTDCFSVIDHVFYSKEFLELVSANTDWSMSMSDHAAVLACLNTKSVGRRQRSRITRLDPNILKGDDAALIKEEIYKMINEAPLEWDPHLKLEYAKMSIRTVLEKAQADRKVREVSEEENLNVELDLAVKTLESTELNAARRIDLIDYVEELRVQKSILIENKGRRLAEKLGTKWYNEGEKSNKYFLGLLRRATPDNFVTIDNEMGTSLNEETEIEAEITNFYKRLYENYDSTNLTINDDSFFDHITGISPMDDREASGQLGLMELGRVLDSCSDSAPGPDGIPYSILRILWQVMGPLILNAWNHSLATGKLAPSHKLSFLKLIPKVGKNLKKLTNWRPITLSNCDHKIITKAYAVRLSEKLKNSIDERQTAYLKGRLINDNVRALISNLRIANLEDGIDGLLVALDAKKAFDSVEHDYIELALRKFGLVSFVPIFRLLYRELSSDIIINGKIVKGFKINRGVKQGDALSCILFILCMEPLLRNIEANDRISPIKSELLRSDLPKSYAYADDVSAVLKNDGESLQQLFGEYERLTRMSGLELNADKTELLMIKSQNVIANAAAHRLRVRYCNNSYDLNVNEKIKINGIVLQQNEDEMKNENVAEICRKMEKHLKTWSARQLSILGKILIVKTFGISQVIYLLQTLNLCENHFKKINAILYKFIWNRHFMAAKGPERIKREIVNKSIKLGGLGMLDIAELDVSLKIKALGRLLKSSHPFLRLIKEKVNLSDFVHPAINTNVEEVAIRAVSLLAKDRLSLTGNEALENNTAFVQAIKSVRIINALNQNGKLSLAWHYIRSRGKQFLGELNPRELNTIRRFMNPDLARRAIACYNLNLPPINAIKDCLLVKGIFKNINDLSSKQIREARASNLPILIYKMGPILTPGQSLTWANCLNKITSTKHKDIVLRLAHGELYSKDRLTRYGLIADNTCPRCSLVETLKHKYFECPYVANIWQKTLAITDKLRTSIDPLETPIEKALCCTNEPKPLALTIHAEIITKIRQFKDEEANLLLLPKLLVKNAIRSVLKREINDSIKTELISLLDDY